MKKDKFNAGGKIPTPTFLSLGEESVATATWDGYTDRGARRM